MSPSLGELVIRAILDEIEEEELRELAEKLAPFLSDTRSAVYTTGSLAAVLGVKPKVIRSAIARGELPAAKQGIGWVISGEAVKEWATPGSVSASVTSTAPRRGRKTAREALYRARGGA